MIVSEIYKTRKDGAILIRTYSNKNKLIQQIETGAKYSEAVDVEPVRYHYIETDDDIPQPPTEGTI